MHIWQMYSYKQIIINTKYTAIYIYIHTYIHKHKLILTHKHKLILTQKLQTHKNAYLPSNIKIFNSKVFIP